MKILIGIQKYLFLSFETFLSFARILIQSRFFNILKHAKTSEKPCLILGNGPSLNDTLAENSAEVLQSFDLMAVNAAAEQHTYTELKPNLYVLNAVSYFQNDEDLSDFYISAKRSLFKALLEKTTWNLLLIVPFRAKKSLEFQSILSQNKNLKACYFNQTPIEGLNFYSNLLFKMGLGMPRPHNVLIPGIMSAIGLGYKTIVLVGADHSWLKELSVNDKNEALLRHVHFYATDGSKPMKVEDRIERPRKLHEVVEKFYLSFKSYWEIRTYSQWRDVKIYNASTHSMIDAFERKTLAEIVDDKTHK